MAYRSETYKPNAASRKILEAAWEAIQSVPYTVTARWLFYRLLQDGHYSGKDDYKTFIGLLSKARLNYWQEWRPDTLADDTRAAITHDGQDESVEGWARDLSERGVACRLDHWYRQKFYVELWFEAEAMKRQFAHYTSGITLRPFKGCPSIDCKWQIAKQLEEAGERYGLPIVILYYGDFDDAGVSIPEDATRDIREWCDADFDFVRVGLNEGDGERYGLPENIDKPGCYQWEAVGDQLAREMITGAVARYVDQNIVKATKTESHEAEKAFLAYVNGFYKYWQNATRDNQDPDN